ncbi:hypothetical protein AXF42_Ash008818 [Apostasia shenzhenica]|uniref:Methyltransferase type 11 domain-containing protein n=1 Tax=Apostasia shenzhenica TaxID=1088818 RepID=A0A2I0ASK2_9ASPA|nr:hypothetical protein AXF42_Ash008818 [Apostasia shenzhenica]
MADLFRKQAQNYAAARPTYPPELFRYIASKCPSGRLAWDVGTGSGQAAASLATLFDSVVATDASPEQLSYAPAHLLPNVRFVLTPPAIPLADVHRLIASPGAVDLVTVAQALHWFDLPAFYALARAVLRRPGGVLAAWCYLPPVVDGGEVDEIYRRVYESLAPYWAPERKMVEEEYAAVEFPFEAVEAEKGTGPVRGFAAEREMAAGDFLEYVRSGSAYQTARENGVELLRPEVVEELVRAWGMDGKEVQKVRFPISLRIGRVGEDGADHPVF